MALAQMSGVTGDEIKKGMASFRGVDRRFDFKIKNDKIVFLSDYAHHPSEIKQSILSMRALYRDKKLTAVSSRTSTHVPAISTRISPTAFPCWTKSSW